MATYVMSDIHGRQDVFHKMLQTIDLQPEDRLYILGDVIDRGPDGIPLLREIMAMKNAELLLGNHELMLLEAVSPGATQLQMDRWDYNHNAETKAALEALDIEEREKILLFLRTRLECLDLTVGDRSFHLVHGFPGANTHDRLWGRPWDEQTVTPISDRRVILGHTPVPLVVCRSDPETDAYFRRLELIGGHVEILFAPGFVDIDCGCGHSAFGCCLACLRLEDSQAFYVPAPKPEAG